MGQVALLSTDLEIEPARLMFAWNNRLPSSIQINDIQKVPKGFHPQKNVLEKTYHYDFYTQHPGPFAGRTALFWNWPLDLEKLEKCLEIFVGEKDFRSFCSGYEMGSTIRKINSIKLLKLKNSDNLEFYRIEVKGKSFLHHMIRRIVGACLETASKKAEPVEILREALEKKDPEQTLLNAPAKGLMLYKIEYEEPKI